MSKNTKTRAKRMGIKSVFAYGERGRLAVTSFGRGNSAELAVDTDARGQGMALPLRTKAGFSVDSIDEDIDFSRGELEAIMNNPADGDNDDYLGLKSPLEKTYFGREFPQDTARIQTIYSILDIVKILGLYVSDIAYCINNLQNETLTEEQIPEDLLGMSWGNDIKNETKNFETIEKIKKCINCLKPYFGFFSDAFLPYTPKAEDKNKKAEERNINTIRILSTLRNQTAHYKTSSFFFKGDMDKKFTGSLGTWVQIQQNYTKIIDRINDGFLTHSAKNIQILFELLPSGSREEQKKIVEDYYRFSILKVGKNLGMNMKKLRELIIDKYCPEIKNRKHDSYRSKLYTVLDYLLYHAVSDSEELELFIDELRQTSDEKAKETLYQEGADVFWEKIESNVHQFLQKFQDGFPVFSTESIDKAYLNDVKLSAEGEPFVKLLAFLCNFWEGKEINEILTAYIHKFENIQAFLDTLEQLGEKVVFTECTIFNKPRMAEKIASQLRVLVSVGKMKPDLSTVKRPLYEAAIGFLGIPDDSEYLSDKWLAENVLLDQTEAARKKDVNPFRNFIVNNVIKSRRFTYLVRYTKPKTVRTGKSCATF